MSIDHNMDVQFQRVTLQTEGSCLCQPISWSMAAMLRDFVVVLRTPPQAIPLATITMRKSIKGFLFSPICVWGSAWRPFGPPELRYNILLTITMNMNKNTRLRLAFDRDAGEKNSFNHNCPINSVHELSDRP